MKIAPILLSVIVAVGFSCQLNEESGGKKTAWPKWKKPKVISYTIQNPQLWLQDSTVNTSERAIAFAVNRADSLHFAKMDSVLVPVDLSGDLVYYLPFPLEVSYLKDIKKIVFFSYPTQTFAAYEHGVLVYTGPTNMGKEKALTPTGLFFTNWKAKKTISTVNPEWILKWNYNIHNKGGIGWHQYSMPGYPASHSCLRLLEKDAKYLYNWADKWILANKNEVLVKGTPVIIFGSYDFSAPKPWFKLINDPHALDITEEQLKNITAPFLEQILEEQQNRNDFQEGGSS